MRPIAMVLYGTGPLSHDGQWEHGWEMPLEGWVDQIWREKCISVM